MPTFTQKASSQPGLTNRKWPTCLCQVDEQLKKWVGSIPITTHFYCDKTGYYVLFQFHFHKLLEMLQKNICEYNIGFPREMMPRGKK